MEFFSQLSAHSAEINTACTAVLAITTIVYAVLTYNILRANQCVVSAMQAQSRALLRPYVVIAVNIEVGSSIFYLRVSNQGKTPANKLRLTLDVPFYRHGNKDWDIGAFDAFQETIDSFAPGCEITFSLASASMIFSENSELPKSFSVSAEYEFDGERVKEMSLIDLRPFRMANVPQDRHINALKDIKSALDMIGRNIKS